MLRIFEDWDLDRLIHWVAAAEWGVPVRAMEALLARGSAAVDPLRALLREHARNEEETDFRFWPVVVLGELRDPAAAPELAEVIRGFEQDFIALNLAAAEALAKIGAGALPALQSLAESPTPHHRLWAYYAAGRIQEDEAFDFLVSALEADTEMHDVIALALSDLGRKEAVEPILRALPRAEPWQRPDLEDALVSLHGSLDEEIAAEDWRLRYRWQPGVGFFPLNWITIGALVRGDEHIRRKRMVAEVRSLDVILAEAGQETEEPDLCECCGVPTWPGTGVPFCPETAASLPFLQEKMLDELAVEEELDDLFDVLDTVEDRLAELESEKPVGKPARRRWEDRRTGLSVLRESCIWLVEQGIETVAEGRERLRSEAARAAAVHGSPVPVRSASSARAAEAFPRVGRNEPCPCGSGRKFKKCCGAAGS